MEKKIEDDSNQNEDDSVFNSRIGNILILRDKDKNFFCCEYPTRNCLIFDFTKKVWKPYKIEDAPDDVEYLEFEEIKDICRSYPPFEMLDKVSKARAKKRLERWEKRRKSTKRKVIGWAYSVDDFTETDVNNDKDYKDKIAALINDVAEHGYLFTGDVIDLIPIFDDRTYLTLSSRGWGDLLALSHGEADDLAYSMYAYTLKDPFGGELFIRDFFPPAGRYNSEDYTVYVKDEDYQQLKEIIKDENALTIYLLTGYKDNDDKNDSFSLSDIRTNVTILPQGREGEPLLVKRVQQQLFINLDSFNEFLKKVLDKDEDEEDIQIKGDIERIKQELESQPVVILTVTIS